jgi:hypothetical protein
VVEVSTAGQDQWVQPESLDQLDPAEIKAAVLRRWDYIAKRKFTRALYLKGPVHEGSRLSASERAGRKKRRKAATAARRNSR